MTTFDEVLKAALALPVEERAALANQLLESLEPLDEPEWDRLWGEEARRRLCANRDGCGVARSAAEVYRDAEQVLAAGASVEGAGDAVTALFSALDRALGYSAAHRLTRTQSHNRCGPGGPRRKA